MGRPWDRLWLRIEQLGAELAVNNEAFQRLLPRLLSAKEGSPFHLGRGLARAANAAEPLWHDMVSALAALPPDQRNFGLLGGFDLFLNLLPLRDRVPSGVDARNGR